MVRDMKPFPNAETAEAPSCAPGPPTRPAHDPSGAAALSTLAPSDFRHFPRPPPSASFAYSIEETAKLIGLGRTALYAEVKSGRLVARKIGRRTVILEGDLAAYLAGLPTVTAP